MSYVTLLCLHMQMSVVDLEVGLWVLSFHMEPVPFSHARFFYALLFVLSTKRV